MKPYSGTSPTRYDWPGNVRELQNAIERAKILAQNGRLRIDLPGAAIPQPARLKSRSDVDQILTEAQMRERERANIAAALAACNGKVSGKGGAAERLQMNPTTLASRIKALGLR